MKTGDIVICEGRLWRVKEVEFLTVWLRLLNKDGSINHEQRDFLYQRDTKDCRLARANDDASIRD